MEEMKRIIVAGSRTFENYDCLETILDRVLPNDKELEIISGHAKGADTLGEEYAKKRNLRLTIFPAKWKELGRRAGFMRNQEMLDYAQQESPMLVAFWDGESHGTKHMIEIANNANVEIVVFNDRTNKLEHFNEDLSGVKESVELFYKEHEWLMNKLAKGPDEELDIKEK